MKQLQFGFMPEQLEFQQGGFNDESRAVLSRFREGIKTKASRGEVSRGNDVSGVFVFGKIGKSFPTQSRVLRFIRRGQAVR